MKPKPKDLVPQSPAIEFTENQIELIKRTIARDATDDELQLFLGICRRTGLDPFARQIYAVKRYDTREKRNVMQTQTSIDGFRLIANRSKEYRGQLGPFWCGTDGVWRDAWIPDDEPPRVARVGALKADCVEPFWGVAKFSEYVVTFNDGNPMGLWQKMPSNQLAKCAEALALRKAFPQDLSGLYIHEEMAQAGSDGISAGTEPQPEAEPAKPPRPPEPERAQPWSNFPGLIKAFEDAKERLRKVAPDSGEEIYYGTLWEFGKKHANEFKNYRSGAECYKRLLAKIQQLEREHAEKQKPQQQAAQPQQAAPKPEAEEDF